MFGAFEGWGPLGRWGALAAVAAAVLVGERLQAVALRLRAVEGRSRWASTGRDLVNTASLALLFLAFLLCGIGAPAAFLFAGTVSIALEVVWHGARTPRARTRRVLGTGLGLSLPLAAFAPQALGWADRIASTLVGR